MKGYFKRLKQMTVDISTNLRRIGALAVFEYKLGTKDLFLGRLWKLLSPLIQIGVYWLVFGIGLRSGTPVDGFPLCGMADLRPNPLDCHEHGDKPWFEFHLLQGIHAHPIQHPHLPDTAEQCGGGLSGQLLDYFDYAAHLCGQWLPAWVSCG